MRVAALVKQIPKFERMTLGPDGRLQREGIELEMSAYCRRAVAKGVELVREHGGECVVITMGPPSAEDCLREAIACGADRGVLLTDRAFAGSDTLATARALERVMRRLEDEGGPFDLILAGKNSVDADTGQVGPELAELLGLPFAGPVKQLELAFHGPEGDTFEADCETDAGMRRVVGSVPAVLSCAERLTAPAKADSERQAAVDAALISTLVADDLGDGEWGADGSPTWVGRTRVVEVGRTPVVLEGENVAENVGRAVDAMVAAGVLPLQADVDEAGACGPASIPPGGRPEVWAVAEASQRQPALELAQEAVRLACVAGGSARLFMLGGGIDVVPPGLSGVTVLAGPHTLADEDHAAALTSLVAQAQPWGVLLPSTARGREVSSRVAAALGLGLTGDAVELDVDRGGVRGESRPGSPTGQSREAGGPPIRDNGDTPVTLVAWKPAFGGQLVAAIGSRSAIQMATVRPGVLPLDESTLTPVGDHEVIDVPARDRVRVVHEEVEDDLEALATAAAVIGVGVGLDPAEYHLLDGLLREIPAELGATRKVTDKAWMPRSRQIGITGRAIAPQLFVSIGASGKFNHSVGFRAARFVLAVNRDVRAPVFTHCDIGIVGDWHEIVPLLQKEIAALPR